jgi:hypothetical protein
MAPRTQVSLPGCRRYQPPALLLSEVVAVFRTAECARLHDAIYGLLALVALPGDVAPLKVDYDCSLLDLVTSCLSILAYEACHVSDMYNHVHNLLIRLNICHKTWDPRVLDSVAAIDKGVSHRRENAINGTREDISTNQSKVEFIGLELLHWCAEPGSQGLPKPIGCAGVGTESGDIMCMISLDIFVKDLGLGLVLRPDAVSRRLHIVAQALIQPQGSYGMIGIEDYNKDTDLVLTMSSEDYIMLLAQSPLIVDEGMLNGLPERLITRVPVSPSSSYGEFRP